MMKPLIGLHDTETGETITREATDEEYAQLLADGWTDQIDEPTEP
jgi:hypothetical protein